MITPEALDHIHDELYASCDFRIGGERERALMTLLTSDIKRNAYLDGVIDTLSAVRRTLEALDAEGKATKRVKWEAD